MKGLFYIVAFFLLALFGKAQVFYIDVSPDSCVCAYSGPTTSSTIITTWDLDNNGVNDFVLESISYKSDCMHGQEATYLTALGNNKVAGDIITGNAFMLNAGDTINKQPSWLSFSILEYYSEFSGWSGYWKDPLYPNSYRYAGIKFYAGATLYYGWLRMNVLAACSQAKILVKEYAYGLCLNNCLTSVKEIKLDASILIFPNPNNGSFNLKIDTEIENGEIVLFNSLGQKVHEQKISQGENQINTNGLSKGLYNYVLLQNKQRSTSGKLIIE